MVEQWFPKPKVKGSSPFFPDEIIEIFILVPFV